MKTRIKLFQLFLVAAFFLPQLSFATTPPAVQRKSRKLTDDTSRISKKKTAGLRAESTAGTVSDLPYSPSAMGLGANSYIPSAVNNPVVAPTGYVMPPTDNGMGVVAAVAPMLTGIIGSLFNSGSSKSNDTKSGLRANSRASSAVDDTNLSQLEGVSVDENATVEEANTVNLQQSAEDLAFEKELEETSKIAPGSSKYSTSTRGLSSMKRDPVAASGACLAPVESMAEVESILRRNNVKLRKPYNAKQVHAVAVGIQQLELLNGGPGVKSIDGVVFTFPKVANYSEQKPDAIHMGANHHDGNVAHVMHELGHYAGNHGAARLYSAYKSGVSPRCRLTTYANKDYTPARARNEEFAEVWAAFITRPDMLKDHPDAACQKAFAVMAREFPQASKAAVCDRGYLSSLAGKGDQLVADAGVERKAKTARQ